MASVDERLREVIQQRLGDLHHVEIPPTAPSENASANSGGATGSNSSNAPQHRHLHITVRTQQQPTNNNNGEFPQQAQNLFHMRDRLFLALFFRISLIYARAFPKTLRRLLEFCLLMQSILLLFILTYIHAVYNQTPITCLAEYKNSWPKDGILRVEITADSGLDYDIHKSYEKEERLRQRSAENSHDDLLTMMLTADTFLLDKMVTTAGELLQAVTSSAKKDSTTTEPDSKSADTGPPTLKPSESSPGDEATGKEHDDDSDMSMAVTAKTSNSTDTIDNHEAESDNEAEELNSEHDSISPSFVLNGEDSKSEGQTDEYFDSSGLELYFNKTIEEIEVIKMNQKKQEEEAILTSSLSDFEMFANSVWLHDQAYIVEYALEYGFLRLSPETRQRLNIPVKIVTLDPSKEACFGDGFSRFLLDNFLGYDDVLMSSIKNLAESEDNKGYLRNVVTGEQFRFVPMWMARTAYVPALLIMLVFTVSISMLLRYSHHQIFVFIVDLLNNIEGVGAIHIPAAPLFTVILALVGMEAIMSEFFNDTSTAFYVILIVWIADQYDSVCSHTPMTRTYWVRFFYLYHFAFYAYHYRFNGQYGGLALLVSWSFIQHSMVYFYHHYELPTILRQAQQEDDDYPTNAAPTSGNTSSASTQTTTISLSAELLPRAIRTQPVNQSQPSNSQSQNLGSSGVINPNLNNLSSTSSVQDERHNLQCNISNNVVPTSSSEQIESEVVSSASERSQSDRRTSDYSQANLLLASSQRHDSQSALASSIAGHSNFNNSEGIGLNFNLNDQSPSTSSGLRLRTTTSLPHQNGEQQRMTREPQPQNGSDADDELD